jgi:hypothetical protein
MQIYKLPKRTIYGLFPDRTRENPKSNGENPTWKLLFRMGI